MPSPTCAATANWTRNTCSTSRQILDRLEEEADREAIVDCARGVYWLYAEMFRGLDARPAVQERVQARRLA